MNDVICGFCADFDGFLIAFIFFFCVIDFQIIESSPQVGHIFIMNPALIEILIKNLKIVWSRSLIT